jgi:hypothetical protein
MWELVDSKRVGDNDGAMVGRNIGVDGAVVWSEIVVLGSSDVKRKGRIDGL